VSRALVRAARKCAQGYRDHGDGILSIQATIKSGWAVGRRSAVAHRAVAAEILSLGDDAVMVAWWACGTQTVDAVPLADPTEFRQCLPCLLSQTVPSGPVVYRCHDAAGDLLYIGSSINMTMRQATHQRNTRWWHEVASVTYEQHDSELSARRAESHAIATEPTVYNRQGTLRDQRLS
jgi:hypothetical protein